MVRDLVDFVLLSPPVAILFLMFCGRFVAARRRDLAMAIVLLFVCYAIACLSLVPKNPRFALPLDPLLRLCAASMVVATVAELRLRASARTVILAALVLLVAVSDARAFRHYFVTNGIYDPVAVNLLAAEKFLPGVPVSVGGIRFLMADRRTFLKLLAAAAAATAAGPASAEAAAGKQPASPGSPIRKATLINMLPRDLPYAARFAMAREAGFDAIEMQTIARAEEAAEIREAARPAGMRIHSVMNMDHWRLPLSSSDPDVVARSVQGMETSLRNAALWGADTVLLVPAVVDAATPYRDAYQRSQRVIRERLLPIARDLKVVIAVEEVWNKFLLSPMEFARYIDEFDSPWLKAYFDVGNVVLYAFPQDWIRTLGPRIVKVHLKDFNFDRQNGRFTWKPIGEGDIDWLEVRRALGDIGYTGYVTTEVSAGDAALPEGGRRPRRPFPRRARSRLLDAAFGSGPLPHRIFGITSFGVMVALGALAGLWVFRRELARAGLPDAAVDAAMYGLVGGLLGAKLLYVFEHLGKGRSSRCSSTAAA